MPFGFLVVGGMTIAAVGFAGLVVLSAAADGAAAGMGFIASCAPSEPPADPSSPSPSPSPTSSPKS